MRIRNWEKYQHYKDRCPPWIKLHYELLSSHDWVMLDDASRVLMVALMLLASRNDGNVPNDPAYVQRVAYLSTTPNYKPLIECGFLIPTEPMLADASELQADASERYYREETEKRQRRDRDIKTSCDLPPEGSPEDVESKSSVPDCPYQELVAAYHEILPELPAVRVLTETRKKHVKARWRECYADGDFKTQEEGIEAFKGFFNRIRESKFLMGKVRPQNGRGQFTASFDFVFLPEKFAKIVEGRYHNAA